LPDRASATGTDEQAIAGLTELFGRPGFDSSARAAVFCEMIRELTLEQALATAAALTRGTSEVGDPTVRKARHLLRGIVQSGPLKSAERAAVLLTSLFHARPMEKLVAMIEAQWNTENNW